MKNISVISLFLFATIPFSIALCEINGQVIESKTHKPLEGAIITLNDSLFSTATDARGEFVFMDVPPDQYTIKVIYIGYKSVKREVYATALRKTELRIYLEPLTLEGESIIVTGKAEPNHAVKRTSPIAFDRLPREELQAYYTTGDLPDLLLNVPGVWSTSGGLGESEMYVRGFASNGVRFMVNDIPINNPEDHSVVWSDWSGLSYLAHSVEIQRGPGFSLYSPNSFGGTVNISTIGLEPQRRTTFRAGMGIYKRMGIQDGPNLGKIYDPANGELQDGSKWPVHYVYSGRFNFGPMYNGKLNVCLFFEHKSGDAYLMGTNYSGYTFGIEAESKISSVHQLYFIFFVNPQSHGQAFTLQDIDLLSTLGREYNRKNHEWQENYYTKPFGAIKHDWQLSENMVLTNNLFFTMGEGADQTLANDIFDTETGILAFQPSMRGQDAFSFGMHAIYLNTNFSLMTTDFITENPMFAFKGIPFEDRTGGVGVNFFADQYTHSYQSRKTRNHRQFGLVSYVNHRLSSNFYLDYGLDTRYWRGHRESEVRMLKISNIESNRSLWAPYPEDLFIPYVQSQYNFDTDVFNLSFFGKFSWRLSKKLIIQGGLPLNYSHCEVIENPIQLIDFGTWKWFPVAKRTTVDMRDYGLKYSTTNDYLRQYFYLTPWFGGNYNFNERWNVYTRLAAARKEPAVLDWYDYSNGPLLQSEVYPENEEAVSLVPESLTSFEIGVGYIWSAFSIHANYYYSLYHDKIETVVDINERRTTLNAGDAVFQGIESVLQWQPGNFHVKAAITVASNRWQKMNVKEIFNSDAADVVGKEVPFAPEHMLSSALGYTLNFNRSNQLLFEIRLNYWNEYYGTYTNTYTKANEVIIDRSHYTTLTEHPAKLPYFLEIHAQIGYKFKTTALDFNFRIDVNNILNRSDNFLRAQYSVDYTRNDFQAGKYNWYVLQAPLFNIFFTTEIGINSI
jgi:hypothetical protein